MDMHRHCSRAPRKDISSKIHWFRPLVLFFHKIRLDLKENHSFSISFFNLDKERLLIFYFLI